LLSASQANPSIPDMSPATQKRHEKHLQPGKSYPGMLMADYVSQAGDLARSAIGGDIDGYKAADGGIVRYNKLTNDYAKGFINGVATMYKPKDGIDYFTRAMQREGGTQND
jgi:pyocin large subunit-like protein